MNNYVEIPKRVHQNIKTTNDRPYDVNNINKIIYLLEMQSDNLSDKQIASIVGNIIEESGGDPDAVSPGNKFNGLLQMSEERANGKTLEEQVTEIINTIHNLEDRKSWNKGKAYKSLKEAYSDFMSDDLETINKGFTIGYVRPKGGMHSAKNRFKVAEQVHTLIKPKEIFNFNPEWQN